MAIDNKPMDNVIQWPDEIHRQLLSYLDGAPTFINYLASLERCLKHTLSISPLVGWWRRHSKRLPSEYCEAEFLDFLERVSFGELPWSEERTRRINRYQQLLQHELEWMNRPAPRDQMVILVQEAFEGCMAAETARCSFYEEHFPDFNGMRWVQLIYHEFEPRFGPNGPIQVVCSNLRRLLSIQEQRGESQTTEARPTLEEYNLNLLDRPVWVSYGSDEYRHILELADWVGAIFRRESGLVFRFLLLPDEEKKNQNPGELITTLTKSSHRLFIYTLKNSFFHFENADVLLALLSLPLAKQPSPNGPPHLTPECLLIVDDWFVDYPIEISCPGEVRRQFLPVWKKFFQRYRDLRLTENCGRAFPKSHILYRLVLATIWGSEDCFEDDFELRCVERSFGYVEPDITCVLDYLNEHGLYNTVYCFTLALEDDGFDAIWFHECATKFSGVMLPVIRRLVVEGWYQLANALLATYLVVLAIYLKGNLDSFDDIPPMILDHRKLPGFEHVEKALDLVCEIAQSESRPITLTRFSQFRQTLDERILAMIRSGEGETVEFKSTLRINLDSGDKDRRIEHSALKTIAGFLNKSGGNLLLGVSDDGQVLGIEKDHFISTDKWSLHLKNLIDGTMPGAMDQIKTVLSTQDNKTVAWVQCDRSERPIYYKNRESKEEEFYVRRGSATDRLMISDALDYIRSRFS